MCRPFFETLKSGSKWSEKEWVFAGNLVYKDLAEKLDSSVFESFIWIERAKFINSIGYRYSILKQIRKSGFEMLIYPSHTRQYWLESIIRVSGARALTPEPVGKYMNDWESALTARRYVQIIKTGPEGQFEFFRNRTFFTTLSPICAAVENLIIASLPEDSFEDIPIHPYGILAPGASSPHREWPLENFAAVARILYEKFGLSIVVLGGKREEAHGQKLQQLLKDIPVLNMAGKLRLIESLLLIKRARILISNESAPVHMAASTQTSTVCISQGNHFSRWNPYPAKVAPWISTVYPSEFGNVKTHRQRLIDQFHHYSDFPIGNISVEQVLAAVEKQMTSIGGPSQVPDH